MRRLHHYKGEWLSKSVSMILNFSPLQTALDKWLIELSIWKNFVHCGTHYSTKKKVSGPFILFFIFFQVLCFPSSQHFLGCRRSLRPQNSCSAEHFCQTEWKKSGDFLCFTIKKKKIIQWKSPHKNHAFAKISQLWSLLLIFCHFYQLRALPSRLPAALTARESFIGQRAG